MATTKQRKYLTTTLKLAVSIALFYFIFKKIDLNQVLKTIKAAKLGWLLLGFLCFVLSKIFNAFRLNCYFAAINLPLTQVSNGKLYLLGMFYNLFLPGGIGGDAFKGYLIKKKFKTATKKVVGVLLLDRLSGMLLIVIFAFCLAFVINAPIYSAYKWFLLMGIPLGVLCFWGIHKFWFSYALPIFWQSLGYSAVVQAIQLLSVICIAKALSVKGVIITYLLVFLISSIVTAIPITPGGVGSRELTFIYGAKWLDLDINAAFAISGLFFTYTAVLSLTGVYYHFKKPTLVSKNL